MKRTLLALPITALAGLSVGGTITTEGDDLVIGSKGDLSIRTADGNFSFGIDGRLMWDHDSMDGLYNQTHDGDSRDLSELRRSRIAFKGTVYQDWHYKLQYEFAIDGDDSGLQDGYIKYTGMDCADFMIGRFKVPFGLEEMTSSKYISTIERSAMFDILNAGRNDKNLQFNGGGANYGWTVGLYEGGSDDDGGTDFGYGGRVTFAPIMENGQILHLGAAFLDSGISDTAAISYRTRLGIHTADRTTLAGGVTAEDQSQIGLEAAWQSGPFSVQGEYATQTSDDTAGDEVEFSGYYLQGTWTLTGEPRSYKAKAGAFDKIKPQGDKGAIELVAKLEQGEIDDDRPGTLDQEYDVITLGVNWYANKNVRVSLNYVMSEIDEPVPGTVPGTPNPVSTGNLIDDGDAISTRIQLIW